MKKYLTIDPWKIIEDGFHANNNRVSESVFSLGNGHMGQRANFEEDYSGDTLQGNYLAGIYYPDKTRVGWWKNGYPEYFAKVLNAPNWIGIHVKIDGEILDLAKCKIESFHRVLNMKNGFLKRTFVATLLSGKTVEVESIRFVSFTMPEIGAIHYSIIPKNFEGQLTLTPYIDGDIQNEDANYNDKFWDSIEQQAKETSGHIMVKTKKTEFSVCSAMTWNVLKNNDPLEIMGKPEEKEKYVANKINLEVKQNEKITFIKFAANVTSRDHAASELKTVAHEVLEKARQTGFESLLDVHCKTWKAKWQESDIIVQGDDSAQQGIRFNIFQLNQTYTGEDDRLNIGPKGFTGEKYGGSTYWDTEAFCFPFYLATADQKVARQLLIYRYKQLGKAIENAEKLGFKGGAALYPMVTMNGEECHNEWEITFEEIHRNGAIAYAIYNYVRYTDDKDYLADYGLEVLIAISRFWKQRVNLSKDKNQYVILGVTGPNEYENNVNNNWHTNNLAAWTLQYTLDTLNFVKEKHPDKYQALLKKLQLNESEETKVWSDIVNNMYYPIYNEKGIFLQQDGFLDKDLMRVSDLDPKELPISQHWSWDRILRSCFIKQADVLQSLYFFEDQYNKKTIKHNFDFYEPMTVHESSLSSCIHAVLAARLGYQEKAYKMYLQTARLDLDDYNNDTKDGCHITSMAGSWMAIVQGFGGMHIKNGKLHFAPFIPNQWQSYSFKIRFRGFLLKIIVTQKEVHIQNEIQAPLEIMLFGKNYTVMNKTLTVKLP